MWEAAALFGLVAAAWFWVDSLKVRERAVAVGRRSCERYDLQLLDDTVAFDGIGFGRDGDGQLRLRRSYRFEFSDTGNNRRSGTIVMLGGQLADLRLEPYRLHQQIH